ncbi:carboxylesterase/lipase family protein [Flexibacter flexilis]|nr:carboxylesterase family protein [Flexibacter flexilis]
MKLTQKLGLLLATMSIGHRSAAEPPTLINPQKLPTQSGFISGKTTPDKEVKIFMGIPYATPPVGALRWKAPLPAAAWKGVKQCQMPPPSAMQGTPRPFYCWTREFLAPEQPISEDCLYLNVWTAAKQTTEKRPVIVWIHGGGFVSGSGTVSLYDGEQMARKGVVFVTINYRLGVFGFLAHPQLSAENPKHTSGNYGLLDQMQALRWVKQNIAAFGGDSSNVTVAGQSAGAHSICALMVSPLAKGLFSKVIAQSGGVFSFNKEGKFRSLENNEAAGLRLTQQLGLASVEQLRQLPADSLQKMTGRWSVTCDKVVVPDVRTVFEAAAQNDAPLLTGWNLDDGVSFDRFTAAQFQAKIRRQYPDQADSILQIFPAATDAQATESEKLLNQFSFGWHSYSWAREQAKTGKNKVFLYWFTHKPAGEPDFGAFHSAEFSYALHTLHYWNRPFTAWDFQLSEMMSSYWVNFARNGNPNGQTLPPWPAFQLQSPQIMRFGEEVKPNAVPYQAEFKFLDKIF